MNTRCLRLHPRLLLLLSAAVMPAGALRGHIPQYGVGTVCEVRFREDRLQLVYDLSYDGIWAQAEMLGIDANKNSVVDQDEATLYLERQWSQKISPHVRVLVDGREASLRKTGGRYEGLEGEIFGVPFSLFYDLEVELPGGRCEPGRWYTLEIHDTVVKDETPAKPIYHVPYEGHGDGSSRFRCDFPKPQLAILDATSYVVQDYRVEIRFLFETLDARPLDTVAGGDPAGGDPAGEGGSGERSSAVETEPARRAAQPEGHAERGDSEYSKRLEESVLRYDELGWGAIFALFFLALAWGAGHALTPGHGKSMVAAYLIGTKGRVRDAVILGLVTTITHTGSVFLFGGGVYLLINASTVAASAGHLQNLIIVGTQLVSGLLLVVMGLVLFFRRASGVPPGHDHSHGHGHGHRHDHSHGHGHGHGHAHDHAHTHRHGSDEQVHSHEHGHSHGHGHGHAHEDADSRPHDRAHPDDPSHGHAHEPASAGLLRGGTPRLWDLLALGFSGGLVPCPAGLTVIIIGLQYPHKLLFTLLLLVFFSIGLGAVLVAIGVLLISGKALAGDRVRDGGFFQELGFLGRIFPRSFLVAMDRQGMKVLRWLPAASCLFIAGLGAFFLVRTSIVGKTEIIAMLRLVADWLE